MTNDMPIGSDTQFSIPDHVLSRKAAGDIVLLSLSDEQYYGLDGVGTRVWELIEEGTTFEEAVRVVSAEYGTDPAIVAADLHALIDELRRSNLVIAS